MDKHFILTNGRSGSNFLANTINLHPQAVNYGEFLGDWTVPYKVYRRLRWTGMTWAGFLDWMYESSLAHYGSQGVSALSHVRKRKPINFKWKGAVRTVGVKDFAMHVGSAGIDAHLIDSKDIKVIYLSRKNIVKRYVSWKRMEETKIVSLQDGNTVSQALSIDTNTVLDDLRAMKSEEDGGLALMEKLPQHRAMHIEYEDYFGDPDMTRATNEKVFRFLGVDPIAVASRHRKISSDDLRDSIANYDDLCRTLAGTAFERFLD